jgi:hypothetical protein
MQCCPGQNALRQSSQHLGLQAISEVVPAYVEYLCRRLLTNAPGDLSAGAREAEQLAQCVSVQRISIQSVPGSNGGSAEFVDRVLDCLNQVGETHGRVCSGCLNGGQTPKHRRVIKALK